jgi:hypothetical protein
VGFGPRCGVRQLLAEVAAGELDEDGFERGFVDGEVAQAVGVGGGDDLGQHAVALGEDADAVGHFLGVGDAGDGGQRLQEDFAAGLIFEVEFVDFFGSDGGLEGGGGILHEDFAVVDDGDAVAELVGLFHVVGGEDDGDAFLAELADGLPHGESGLGVQAGGGLVEEEDFGPVGDGAGDLDALGEPAGELRGIGGGAVCEAELVEELGGAGLGLGTGEAEVQAMEGDVFGDGAGAVERVVLGDDADGAARDGRVRDDVDTGDADLAGGGQGARGADADGGGFSGSVGAEQTEELPFVDRKGEAIDGGDGLFAGEDFFEVLDFDDHACWLLSLRL